MTQLRVGLVGSGGISHVHVPAWLELGAKITVFSLEGAEELAARYGLTVADSLDDLLGAVDVVDICTPTPSHVGIATAAAAAGKDVVCEKPLGRTVAEGTAILDAVRAAGTQLYPGHVVRYFPAYAAAKEAVSKGRVGNLAVLRFNRGGAGPATDWFYDQEQSGGIIMDQMIHDLDQALWLAGDVSSVYAVQNAASTPANADRPATRNVSAHVTLTHESGAISHIQGVWGPPTMAFRTSFDIAGDAGALHFDSAANTSVVKNLAIEDSASYLPPAGAEESPYLTEIREFAEAFAGRAESRVSLEDGIIAVALAEAALLSVQIGQSVPFCAASVLVKEEVAR
jgi:myo-inositol 2-dehydrogenase/D-chiro-inositol 1-dehydrogenase